MTEFSELKSQSRSSDTGSSTNETSAGIPEDQIPGEDADIPSLNARPESMIDAERIIDFSTTANFTDEQNYRGTADYGGQMIITLENPTLQHGQLWKSTDENQSADYKVVGEDDPKIEDKVEEVDGDFEQVGITIHGNTFYAEQVDDFEDDRVTLWIGKGAGQHLARLLDTAGGEWAYYDDPSDEEDYGSATNGLFEVPYNYGASDYDPSDDGYPRVARSPTLRADLVDQPIRLMFMFSDEEYQGNRMNQSTAFKLEEVGEVATDGDGNGLELQTLAHGDEHFDEPTHNSYTVWHTPEDDIAAQSSDSDLGGDPTNDGADAAPSEDSDVSDGTPDFEFESSEPLTYNDLDDEYPVAREFVDQLVSNDMTADDLEDFESVVDDARENDGLSDDVSTNDLRSIIDERANAKTAA